MTRNLFMIKTYKSATSRRATGEVIECVDPEDRQWWENLIIMNEPDVWDVSDSDEDRAWVAELFAWDGFTGTVTRLLTDY